MKLADLDVFQKSRKVPAHILNNIPKLASVMINRDCNLRCKHCDWPEQHKIKATLLSKEDWQNFISGFSVKNQDEKTLVISAREPLYDSSSQEKVLSIIETAKEKGIYAGLINNGTRLKDFIEKHPAFRPDFMDISLEGPAEINDQIRGIGSFQKALEGLHSVTKTIDNLFVSITATNINIESLPEFISKLYQNEGVKRFVFHSLVPGKFVAPEISLTDSRFLQLMDKISNLAVKLNLEQIIFDLYPESFTDFPKVISHLNPQDLFVDEYIVMPLAENVFVRFTNILENLMVSFLISPEGYVIPSLEMRQVNYLKKLQASDYLNVRDISSWNRNPNSNEIVSLAKNIPAHCFDRECFRFCLGQSKSCPINLKS